MVEPQRRDGSSRWWGFGALAPLTLVIAGLLVAMATVTGYVLEDSSTPTYGAQAGTMLDQPLPVAQSQDAGYVEKLSRLRLKYAGIAKSDDVLTAAAHAAGVSRDDLAEDEYAKVDSGSLLLYVGSTGDSEKRAIRQANALASALADYVKREQVRAQIAPRDRVELTVLAPADRATKLLPTTRQKLLVAVACGVVAFVVLGGVLDQIRRRQR